MRRVFFFSGYRLKVFEWHDKYLLGSCEFEPDEDGLDCFRRYLRTAVPMPVQFLVDVIEEDFRREAIPHVNSRDRKVVVSRLLDRYYRGFIYQHVEPVGRSKTGRRDDLLLISSLTNNELFAPWLALLVEQQIPLAGIWSLPLLSTRLLKLVADKEENVLLVSRQVQSALRESYFQKSSLVLSRQEKLDRYLDQSDSAEIAIKNLVRGTDQIYHFLTNQRIMGFNDVLKVYYLLPSEHLERARSLSEDGRVIKYHFHDLQDLFNHFKLENCAGEGADTLYAYLCSESPLFADHYLGRKHKSAFYSFILDRGITLAASLGTLLITTLAALLWLNSMELDQQRKEIAASTALLSQRYQRDYVPREQLLADAAQVQALVNLAKRLNAEAKQTPQALFGRLGNVFSEPRYARLFLTGMNWNKYRPLDLQQLRSNNLSMVSEPVDPLAQDYVADDSLSQGYGDDASVGEATHAQQSVLILKGLLERDTGPNEVMPYREVVSLMNIFAESLREVEGVQEVQVMKVPVDVRPGVSFADQGGEKIPLTANDDSNRFEIVLILEPAANE